MRRAGAPVESACGAPYPGGRDRLPSIVPSTSIGFIWWSFAIGAFVSELMDPLVRKPEEFCSVARAHLEAPSA